MTNETDYRNRIYARYASVVQGAAVLFDEAAAVKWGKAYRYYLRHWLPSNRDAQIADLACGGGKLLYFLSQQGYRPCGVDISHEQVALARQVIDQVSEESVITYLERNAGTFDLILAFDLIEHLRKAEVLDFLDSCFRALKPGGKLVLQTPNANSLWGTTMRYGDFTHETGFTPDALERLLLIAGFSSPKSREVAPVPFGYTVSSSVRHFLWRIIKAALMAWNLIETGSLGCRVLTRVFLVAAEKERPPPPVTE